MAEQIFHFVLGVLATWRIAHLLAYEDGPWFVLVRLRRALGRGFIAALWDCLQCSSLWIAVPIAYAISRTAGEGVLTWLGLSGGACLLDRLGRPGLATTSAVPIIGM